MIEQLVWQLAFPCNATASAVGFGTADNPVSFCRKRQAKEGPDGALFWLLLTRKGPGHT